MVAVLSQLLLPPPGLALLALLLLVLRRRVLAGVALAGLLLLSLGPVGTALLAALVDMADNWLGLRRLELEVLADNEPALALYTRFGFEPEGVRCDAVFRAGAHVDTLAVARLRR